MPETGAAAALRVAGATQSPTQKAVGLIGFYREFIGNL